MVDFADFYIFVFSFFVGFYTFYTGILCVCIIKRIYTPQKLV